MEKITALNNKITELSIKSVEDNKIITDLTDQLKINGTKG